MATLAEEQRGHVLAVERRQRIIEMAKETTSCVSQNLSKVLGVSTVVIGRDLRLLEAQGELQKDGARDQ